MNRNKVIDLMKTIGIILVVVGHCVPYDFLERFIYLFHLPLFFLLSGYLYNEKEAIDPWLYIGKKIKKFAILYILYGSFLVLFHNIFLYMGIIDKIYSKYTIGDIMVGILNSFLFQSVEPYSSTMWFIPNLLVSLIVYNFITSFVSNVKNIKEKEIKRTIIILILTILGIYINYKDYKIGLHYQTVFVVLPFIHLGQIIKLYLKDKLKPNLIVSLGGIILSIMCLVVFDGGVELSKNQIWNPLLFYTLAPLLIYAVYTMCFYIDKRLSKMTKILQYIGKNTFQIMCLHITCFKLLDYIVINLITKNYDILSKFPVSYSNYWPAYVIIGVIGPLIGVYLVKKIKTYFLRKQSIIFNFQKSAKEE